MPKRLPRKAPKGHIINARSDSWFNPLTGLDGFRGPGMPRDRTALNAAAWSRLEPLEAEQIYAGDNLARKIVQKVVRSSLRELFKLEMDGLNAEGNEKFNQDFREVLRDYELVTGPTGSFAAGSLITAAEWGRVYGAAYLLVNAEDGRMPWEPLNIKNIKKIRWIKPFTPIEMYVVERSWDVNDNYLEPKYFTFVSQGAQIVERIHHTRLIRFIGHELPRITYISNHFVHDSVLNRVAKQLGDYALAIQGVGLALSEYSQGVFKISGLAQQINSGRFDKILQRLTAMDTSRSLIRSLLMDEKDDYTRVGGTFNGMEELINSIREDLASRTEIPRAILFNEGNTEGSLISSDRGEMEQSEWQSAVSEYQEHRLKGQISRLTEIILSDQSNPLTKGGVPDFEVKFRSDRPRTLLEEAQVYEMVSTTDAANITAGLLSAEEVRSLRYARQGTFANFSLFSAEKLSPDPPEPPEPEPMVPGQTAGGEPGGPGGQQGQPPKAASGGGAKAKAAPKAPTAPKPASASAPKPSTPSRPKK